MERYVVYIHCDELNEGGYPAECPFSGRRGGMALDTIRSLGLLTGDRRRVAVPAPLSREQLMRFHTDEYLSLLEAAGDGVHSLRALEMGLGTPDTPLFKDMWNYLRLAAGGTMTAAELILRGEADIAFNPHGGFHHAHPDRASGFCYLNDAVLAAMTLRDAGKRVLILDVDAHHCDAVQNAFYDTDDVTVISLHESGKTLFPGTGFVEETGTGKGHGFTINVPLPVGTWDDIYRQTFRELLPLIERIAPDVLILEVGMDTLSGDPLAHLNLTNNVFPDLIDHLLALGMPILATGGGGYNVPDTARGWALCFGAFCGEDSDTDILAAGMGGVMLANTDWLGGLRDRAMLSHGGRREEVTADIARTMDFIRKNIFPFHGL